MREGRRRPDGRGAPRVGGGEEARAPVAEKKKTAADAFREIGRWEGETRAELDALVATGRQRLNRQAPDLKYVPDAHAVAPDDAVR